MSEARDAARTVANSTVLELLARAGFIASALVHLLLGYLAIHVALHLGGEADQSGALGAVAALPFGRVILWLTTVSFFALSLWLLIQAGLGIGSSSTRRWLRSLVAAGKAAGYIALGLTAVTFAAGHGTNSRASTRHAAQHVIVLPGGRMLLVAVGLAAVAIGGYFVRKGATRHFKKDIRLPPEAVAHPIVVLGILGYVAKGIVIVVVGILFVVASITIDPARASGLDGALKALAALPFGQVILAVIGAGLIAYAVYTVARARLARF